MEEFSHRNTLAYSKAYTQTARKQMAANDPTIQPQAGSSIPTIRTGRIKYF
jgi:hypothetical protein